MNKDSRYYEAMFEGIFPELKNITETDLKSTFNDVISKLQNIFKRLEIDYKLECSRVVVFNIEKINKHYFDFHISFDLSRYNLDKHNLDNFKTYLIGVMKNMILDRWDSYILNLKNY